MKNIKIASVALAALLSVSSVTALAADASAEWIKNGSGYSYVDDSTGVYTTGWKTIGKKTYYFGSNGIMKTGWQIIDGNTFYFGKNGVMRTGRRKINGRIYKFDKYGVLNGTGRTDPKSNNSAADVLYSLKNYLGSSYPCDNVCGKDEVTNFFGLDTSKLESYVYENDSISAIHMNTALILKTKDGYADTAAKLIQKSFDSFGSYAISYGYDAARTKQARLFVQGNYVGFFILGEETDSDKTAETEAKKIDDAWAKIFGTTPENIVKIPEAFDIEDGMVGDGLEG